MGCFEKTTLAATAEASLSRTAAAIASVNDNDLVVLAVMGKTGAGKSTFIMNASGKAIDAPDIGHYLESCTKNPAPYTFKYRRKTIVLIDNPGFGDTYRDEGEILADIAGFLAQTYRTGVKLSGLVYLHDITNNRMTHEGKANLEVFKLLCGDEPLHKIILATTRWKNANRTEATRFLEQLKTKPEYWKDMIEGGARVTRLDDSHDSALDIVDMFLEDEDQDKVTLTIQDEMVKGNLKVSETAAGKSLNEAIAAAIQDLEAKYAQEHRQMKETFDEQLRQIRKNHSAKTKKKILELRQQQECLDEDERHRSRKIDMELDQWRKRMEQDLMKPASTDTESGASHHKSSGKPPKRKCSRHHHHHHHHHQQHDTQPTVAGGQSNNCEHARDDELTKESEAAAEAERLLLKQWKREHWAKLGTAFTTTAVAGGLSVINPAAIPVAILGGVDTIRCIAGFFRKEKLKKKMSGKEMVADTLAQAMSGGSGQSM